MNYKIIKTQAGFSIIELMIALSIFAIGLLATATMQITALQGNAGAQKRTMLNTVAAGVMEEILTWEPDHPNSLRPSRMLSGISILPQQGLS